MPWRHTNPAEEQIRLIELWLEGGVTVSWLAREFGLSRKTAHKRIERFREWGWEGVGDRSRAPLRHPNRTPGETAELIIQAKLKHPTWGPKKLLPWLGESRPGTALPAASTAGDILSRAGLVRRRRRRQGTAPWTGPLAGAGAPNDTWSVDLKGWFRTQDGVRCDPLTVSDCCTRYCIACKGLERPRHGEVKRELEKAFMRYGLPGIIRTDNGPPFASTGLGGLTELSVWWVKLGITPERIEPGHPEQNGRLERFHRTLKAETAAPSKQDRHSQQQAFDAFVEEYNCARPHEALGQKTPASLYQPSPRQYPLRIRELEYPGHVQVRRVRSNGEVKWKGDRVFLSEALRGEPVGLQQQDTHLFAILFGPLQIGALDDRSRTVLKTPVKLSPMSPVAQ